MLGFYNKKQTNKQTKRRTKSKMETVIVRFLVFRSLTTHLSHPTYTFNKIQKTKTKRNKAGEKAGKRQHIHTKHKTRQNTTYT